MNLKALKPYFNLVRFPNTFTAWADIILSYAISGAKFSLYKIILLICASTCVYWGGFILNDLIDESEDRKTAANRPLVIGEVRRKDAYNLFFILSLLGIFISLVAGWKSLLIYIAILILSCLYNLSPRLIWYSPYLLAGCRFLNICLGASKGSFSKEVLLAGLIIFLHILVICYFSRSERGRWNKNDIYSSLIIVQIQTLCVLIVLCIYSAWLLPLGLAYCVIMQHSAMSCIRECDNISCLNAVKRGLGLVIFIDAVLAGVFAGVFPMLIIIILIIPNILLKIHLEVT